MIAKPSRLARQVSKWQKQTAKAKAKKAKDQQAERKWRALSAMVDHRDCGLCRVCGHLTFKAGDPRSIGQAHHIVYRSAGGKDTMANLIHLCGQCHDDEHQHRIAISGTADTLTWTRL